MAGIIRHVFANPVPDNPAFLGVRPSHWNDALRLTSGNHGALLFRDTTDAIYGSALLASAPGLPYWNAAGDAPTVLALGNGLSVIDGALTAPTAPHASTHAPGGSDALAVDATAGVGSLRTLGTSATSAAAGNDARLSNARPPTTHSATHQAGGSDPIAALDAGVITTGLLADARLSANVPRLNAAASSFTGRVDATEYRLSGFSFARVASMDGSGQWGGGYNFDYNLGAPRHDSSGAQSGVAYKGGIVQFFASGVQTAGTAAVLRAQVNDTGLHVSGLLAPLVDNVYDLGSTSKRFKDGYLSGVLCVGTNPAATGAVRLANSAALSARNAAATADARLLFLDSADSFIIGDGGQANAFLDSKGPIRLRAFGTTHQYVFDDWGHWTPTDNVRHLGHPSFRWIDGYFAGFVAVGTNPAQVGALRLASGARIRCRNAANSRDIAVAGVDNVDNVVLGDQNGSSPVYVIASGVPIILRNQIDATTDITFSANQFYPATTNLVDIGHTALRFRNFYLAGAVRLLNTAQVSWRNAANSADITPLYVDASDRAILGNGTAYTILYSALMSLPDSTNDLGNPSMRFRNMFLSDVASMKVLRLAVSPSVSAGAGIVQVGLVDAGGGKSKIVAVFPTGAPVTIATEP